MAQPPTILFLPGLLCDAALWAHQVEAVRDLAGTAVADLTRDESIAAISKWSNEAATRGIEIVGVASLATDR